MAKRKADCSLNDIICSYLKKRKCDDSLKLFTNQVGQKHETKILRKFVGYLKANKIKKENTSDDDLGFEINFGAYQLDDKVSTDRFTRSEKKAPKIETECKKRKVVPKKFIKKIKELGMRVEDADVLYESKIDWTAVYSNNKIYCIEIGCDFYTKIDNEELTNHTIACHDYGEYPCNQPHCNFVGFSTVRN